MNLLQIRYFLEVSRTLNFTAAAENLYVSQPGISRQIRSLEEELGVQLLRRNHQMVELTKAGEVFQAHFSDIMRQIDEGIRAVRQVQSAERTFHIGQCQGSIEDAEPAVVCLKDYYGDCSVRVRRCSMEELRRKFTERRVDLVIAYAYLAEQFPEAESVPIGTLPWCFLYHKDLARVPENPTPQDFSGKRFLCLKPELKPGLKEAQLVLLKQLGVEPSEVIETDSRSNYFMVNYPVYDTFCLTRDSFSLRADPNIRLLLVDDAVARVEVRAFWRKDSDIPFRRILADI